MDVSMTLSQLADRLVVAEAKTAGRFLVNVTLRPAVYWMKARRAFKNVDKDTEMTVTLHEWKAGEKSFKAEMSGVTDGIESFEKDDVFVDTDPLDVRPNQVSHWELLDVDPIKAAWRAALRNMGGQSAEESKTPSEVPVRKLIVKVHLEEITNNAIILKASYEDWSIKRALVRNMPFASMQRRMQKWILSAGLELAMIATHDRNQRERAIKQRGESVKPDTESALDLRPRNGELREVLAIAPYSDRVVGKLSHDVKNYSEDSHEEFIISATMMAEHVPAGMTLVPAPSSSGTNDSMKVLSEMIGKLTNNDTVEAVVRKKPQQSLHKQRQGVNNEEEQRAIERAKELGQHITKETLLSKQTNSMGPGQPLPANAKVMIVDNVITTGTTMRAMTAVLRMTCDGIVLARAGYGGKTYATKGVNIVGSDALDDIKNSQLAQRKQKKVQQTPIEKTTEIQRQREAACVSASVERGTGRTRP